MEVLHGKLIIGQTMKVNLQFQLTFLGSCNNNYATDLFAFGLNCFTLCRLNCLCSFQYGVLGQDVGFESRSLLSHLL